MQHLSNGFGGFHRGRVFQQPDGGSIYRNGDTESGQGFAQRADSPGVGPETDGGNQCGAGQDGDDCGPGDHAADGDQFSGFPEAEDTGNAFGDDGGDCGGCEAPQGNQDKVKDDIGQGCDYRDAEDCFFFLGRNQDAGGHEPSGNAEYQGGAKPAEGRNTAQVLGVGNDQDDRFTEEEKTDCNRNQKRQDGLEDPGGGSFESFPIIGPEGGKPRGYRDDHCAQQGFEQHIYFDGRRIQSQLIVPAEKTEDQLVRVDVQAGGDCVGKERQDGPKVLLCSFGRHRADRTVLPAGRDIQQLGAGSGQDGNPGIGVQVIRCVDQQEE